MANRSDALFEAANRVMPGGVSSPVRAFKAVGGTPPTIARGSGSHIVDVDGREYIDYVMSWGPLILGHAHPAVVDAVCRAASAGTSFGAPTQTEVELAQLITAAMPSIEQLRFTSSGTEACMGALRLARAFTGRSLIVKCAGCYHGHSDGLLVAAGSGALTFGVPDSAGVIAAQAAATLVVPYNDAKALAQAFRAHGDDIAAFIVEPIAGNMGVVTPRDEFVRAARDLTAKYGALLIYDEVMTGFRVAYGGAQSVLGVRPDITCLGKIIGGGLPVGAFGGRTEIMQRIAPAGDVYQAGTLSGNPVAMAAGLAQLRELAQPGIYERLEQTAIGLVAGLQDAFKSARVGAHVARAASMWTAFFTPEPVSDLASARRADTKMFAAFFQRMLRRGVYLPPAQFEAAFVSTSHSPGDLALTIAAMRDCLEELAG